MKHKGSFFTAVMIAGSLLSACGNSTQGPTTWIDRPLDGDQLQLSSITIQAHSSDADGVARIQFFISEEAIGEVATNGERLGSASMEWMPPAPGSYIITAQAIDQQGNSGPTASVKITVAGEIATQTPTPAPASLECAAAALVAPALVSPADGAVIAPDAILTWSYPDATCHPQSFRVDISEDASFSDVGWGFGTLEYNETSRQWPLPAGKCYYWRALAYVPDMNGPASSAWQFCVTESSGPSFTLSQNASCRAGPGTDYEAVETLMQGQIVSIKGINEDHTWLLVGKPSGSSSCWVSTVTGRVVGNLEEVQVVNITPLTEAPAESSDDTPPNIADIFVDPSTVQVEGCGEPSTALVGATVSDAGGVDRVVARIPGYGEVELTPSGGDGYEATLGPFSETNEFVIIFLAWDHAGNGAQAGPIPLTVACIE